MCFSAKKVTYGGTPEQLVWAYDPKRNRRVDVVAESPYEVVFKRNGEIKGIYRMQKYKYLSNGGDVSKFYFVNVQMPCRTEWGTREKLEFQDADSGRIVSIGAGGTVAFRVSDSELFLGSVVGPRTEYGAEQLSREMLPKILDVFNEFLLATLREEKISYGQLDENAKRIGARIRMKINEVLEAYGVYAEEFIISRFVKPEILKEKTNVRVEKAEVFEDQLLDNDRVLELMKKKEIIDQQAYKMARGRAVAQSDLRKIEGETDAELRILAAQADAEAEVAGLCAKGVTYRELREMDREDVRVAADAVAMVEKAKKTESEIVVVKTPPTGKCPHCGGDIAAGQIFCPTCRKKLI